MYFPEFLRSIPAGSQEAFVREVEERMRPRLHHDGMWVLDYVRLRFAARRLA